MALYFGPTAQLVMASVRPQEQGIASGANNSLREVGGALGVAALSAVFSAQGGYQSARAFTDGLAPALYVGAVAVAVGALAAVFIPRRRQAAAGAETAETAGQPVEDRADAEAVRV